MLNLSIQITAHERLNATASSLRHRLEIHIILHEPAVRKMVGSALTSEQVGQVFTFLESDQLLRDRLREFFDALLPDRIGSALIDLAADDTEEGGEPSYARHIEGN